MLPAAAPLKRCDSAAPTGVDDAMASSRADRPLWACPECGRTFANRRQSHACGRQGLESRFDGEAPEVRRIYGAFLVIFASCGAVTALPEKSRIVFHDRMSFVPDFAQALGARPFHAGAAGGGRAIHEVESLSTRNVVHHFRLERADEVEGLRAFAREAYAVGCQRHLAWLSLCRQSRHSRRLRCAS
jgi:hypothetical protein